MSRATLPADLDMAGDNLIADLRTFATGWLAGLVFFGTFFA